MIRIPLFGSLILLLFGCGSSSEPTTAAIPSSQFSGYVLLRDLNCNLKTSSAGITVQIDSGRGGTVTDSSGHWVIEDFPTGYYVLHFFKPGYTEYRIAAYFFPSTEPAVWNPNKDWFLDLYGLSNWTVRLGEAVLQKRGDTTYSARFPEVSVHDTLGKSIDTFELHFFVGKTPRIDYQDPSTFICTYRSRHLLNDRCQYDDLWLWNKSFQKGDTLYTIAYVDHGCANDNYDYQVQDSLITRYSGFGTHSEVQRIILP